MRLNVSVNSGAALLLYIVSLFGILFMVAYYPAVEKNVIGIMTALTSAFGGFLVKRNSNNKISLEADKAGLCTNGTTPTK